MKVIKRNRQFKCPYCGTIVELNNSDIRKWNNVEYFVCPECYKTPHIRGGNFWTPFDICGKKAKEV